jgi:hypothetical protein
MSWRHFSVSRTRLDGKHHDQTPVGLTLLNRGLTGIIGRNAVALETWSWASENEPGWIQGDEEQTNASARQVRVRPTAEASEWAPPGLILLAATGLKDEGVLCGFVRDGITNVRERGCGCMQSTDLQGPALLFGIPQTEIPPWLNAS